MPRQPAVLDGLSLKKTYKATSKLEVFYTGGSAKVSRDGKLLACTCNEEVKVVDIATGAVTATIKGDTESITALAVSPDCRTLVTASRSLLMRVYDMTTGAQLRSWKGHKAPVADLAADASGGYVASASADRSVKVWDVSGGFCTHNFTGHTGVVLRVLFHPKQLQLFSASDDASVRVWDLVDKTCVHVLKAHFSAVTSLALSPDGWLLLSGGRDKVVVVWDLRTGAKVSTVPVYEAVEGMAALPLGAPFPGVAQLEAGQVLQGGKKQVYFATAGEKGGIKLWRSDTGACVHTVPPELAIAGSAASECTDLALLPGGGGLLAATADARLLFYTTQAGVAERRLTLSRQLIGNQDQVTDLRLVGPAAEPSHIAVATNSEAVRLYALANMSCAVSLVGHRDIVLALDGGTTVGGVCVLASGGKDQEVRLWEAGSGRCLAVGVGHVGAVNSVALSRKARKFLVSVGADKLIKVWDIQPAVAALALAEAGGDEQADGPAAKKAKKAKGDAAAAKDAAALAKGQPLQLRTLAAAAGHDKDINAVAVAPNDMLCATASQDRTIRVWKLPDLVQVCALRGHKRGVWAVEFAPLDRALLSASGDKTVKMWSLADHTCLRTFEGHTASVLRATFATAGTQVLSCGADGLVKLWSVASGECISTFDEHEDKIWALTTGGQHEGLMATGGADACVVVWADTTEADAAVAAAEEDEQAQQEQDLQNALARSDFGKAARLAFRLRHPGRLLSVITRAATATANAATAAGRGKAAAATGARGGDPRVIGPLGELLSGLVGAMSDEDVRTALEYCREWNTNAKHCHAAQALLGALLRSHKADKLLSMSGIADLLSGLSVYSQRHFSRLDRLVRSTYLLDYTLNAMKVVDPTGEAAALEAAAAQQQQQHGRAGSGAGGARRVEHEEEDEEAGLLSRLAQARAAAAAASGSKRRRDEEDSDEEDSDDGGDEGEGAGGQSDGDEEESGSEDSSEEEEEGAAGGGHRRANGVGHGVSADDVEDDFELDSDLGPGSGSGSDGDAEDEDENGASPSGSGAEDSEDEDEDGKGGEAAGPRPGGGGGKAAPMMNGFHNPDGNVGSSSPLYGSADDDNEEEEGEEEDLDDEGEQDLDGSLGEDEDEMLDGDDDDDDIDEEEEGTSDDGDDEPQPPPTSRKGQAAATPVSSSGRQQVQVRQQASRATPAPAPTLGAKGRAASQPSTPAGAKHGARGAGGGKGAKPPPATAPPKAVGQRPKVAQTPSGKARNGHAAPKPKGAASNGNASAAAPAHARHGSARAVHKPQMDELRKALNLPPLPGGGGGAAEAAAGKGSKRGGKPSASAPVTPAAGSRGAAAAPRTALKQKAEARGVATAGPATKTKKRRQGE